jgi:hypothetical protein
LHSADRSLIEGAPKLRTIAECNSAIQQIENLRYARRDRGFTGGPACAPPAPSASCRCDWNHDSPPMKTAYELAMERLTKAAPVVRLTDEQKQRLAELDSKYKAKIAEREIHLQDEIAQAAAAGDVEKAQKLDAQLTHERQKLRIEMEEKKEQVRQAKG